MPAPGETGNFAVSSADTPRVSRLVDGATSLGRMVVLLTRTTEGLTMNTLHAHIETASQDCDGGYRGSHVVRMNDDELSGHDRDNWFGDLLFRERIVGSIVSTIAVRGTLEVRRDEGDEFSRLEWSEQTEEGGSSSSVRFCSSESCSDVNERRDLQAEAAGY